MNRRQLLVSGGSVLALALAPAVVAAAPTTTFVAPTTNIVHLAGRIGQKYRFDVKEVLNLLGLDPDHVETATEAPTQSEFNSYWWNYDNFYGESVDVARSLAERGARDIYERARLMVSIKRKLNLRFNFSPFDETKWMDSPSPRLQGKTFRTVMKEDLRHAAQVLDFALKD